MIIRYVYDYELEGVSRLDAPGSKGVIQELVIEDAPSL
jgi:hypothetical protein